MVKEGEIKMLFEKRHLKSTQKYSEFPKRMYIASVRWWRESIFHYAVD